MRRRAKPKTPADILVVGGGPSGLVTSIALAAAGFYVTCLERSAQKTQHQLKPDGRLRTVLAFG